MEQKLSKEFLLSPVLRTVLTPVLSSLSSDPLCISDWQHAGSDLPL